MRKSLALILSIAMVFSMFSSLAFAAEAETAEEKYEALVAAGIFAGVDAEGNAALNENMTRAQFARVAGLLLSLDVDAEVSVSKFQDVSLTHWAVEEVHAIDAAGIMNGHGNMTFTPEANVTIEQVARVLVDALGLEVDADAEVEGASTWAQGYVKAAVANGLISASADFQANATRELLVVSSYAAYETIAAAAEPDAQSVVSVTATGAKELTVVLAKAGVASELKFSVKKGAANVAIATTDGYTWSTDKKTVVITLASKFTEGTYTVTVAPATADDKAVGNGTKEVTVTNEIIKSIEILTASETIAKYDDNRIAFAGINQYGEESDLGSSAYQVAVGNTNAVVTSYTDKQEVKLDVSNAAIVKDTRVALTLVAPNATATTTKVFIVGDAPSVAKIEVGDLVLADDKERLTAGESAVLKITAYDQYGNKVAKNSVLKATTTLISTRTGIIPGPNSTTEALGLHINSDGNLAIVTTADSVTADTDVVLTLIGNGSGTGTNATVKVSAARMPVEVAFGDFTGTVAKGDGTIYLPLVVTDQFGEAMSAKDIATTHLSKFTIFSNNSSVLTSTAIHTTADANQGKVAVAISAANTGNATITVMINGNNKTATFPITVQDVRVPDAIVIDSAPAPKALPTAVTGIKYKIQDQYGKNIGSTNAAYRVDFVLERVSGDAAVAFSSTATGTVYDVFAGVSDGVEFTLTADQGKFGTAKLTAKLVKIADGSVVSSVSNTIEAVKADVANDLTYEVAQVGSIYDASVLVGNADAIAKQSKEITVGAKDASGNKVALPSGVVTSVYSSDTSVASVTGVKVYGEAKGTATLTVTFAPVAGNTKIATQTVTVSDVLPTAATLTVANATKANTVAVLNGKAVWDGEVAGDIKLVDSYGIEYKNADLVDGDFASSIKVTIAVTNVKGGSVSVNSSGVLAVSGAVESFTIQVYSLTNGTIATTNVTVY